MKTSFAGLFKPLVFLLFIEGCALFSAAQQPTDSACKTFLKVNSKTLENTVLNEADFGKGFLSNQFFFVGENHGYAAPHGFDVSLFTLLNKSAGVKHYIAEVDATKAWLLNRFLTNGDTAWLRKVFTSWIKDTAQWASHETFEKYRQLQAVYKQLPAAKKFSFVGIDVPQDYSLIHQHIAALTGNARFGTLAPYMDSLKAITAGLTYTNRKELTDFAKRLLPHLQSQEGNLKKSLRSGYTDFLHLITSLTYIGSGMTRDSVMYRNFKNQATLYGWKNYKFYGYLGYAHTLQTGYNSKRFFAGMLKDNEGLQGKITSLQMFILESRSMMPNVPVLRAIMPASAQKTATQPGFPTDGRYIAFDLNNDNKMLLYTDGIEWLRELSAPEALTLFRLTGAGSPFATGNRLAQVSGMQPLRLTNSKDVTTDAFQYILLFRGSKAATPLLLK